MCIHSDTTSDSRFKDWFPHPSGFLIWMFSFACPVLPYLILRHCYQLLSFPVLAKAFPVQIELTLTPTAHQVNENAEEEEDAGEDGEEGEEPAAKKAKT